MSTNQPDVFEHFAAQRQLQLRAEPLVGAPRDVLVAPDEADQLFLVTLSGPVPEPSVQSVFIKPACDPSPPDAWDVLWWLAADAWAVRQSGRDLARWAHEYRYPAETEATGCVFQQHLAQNDALERVLGHADYECLLSLYDAEVARVGKP